MRTDVGAGADAGAGAGRGADVHAGEEGGLRKTSVRETAPPCDVGLCDVNSCDISPYDIGSCDVTAAILKSGLALLQFIYCEITNRQGKR